MLKQNLDVEPTLIIVDSHGIITQRSLLLSEGEQVTIGRTARDNGVIVSDNIVSGVHGHVFNRNGHFMYKDMRSRNGSYVETAGQRVLLHDSDAFVELTEGSVVRIGDLKNPEKMVLMIFTYMSAGQTIKKYNVVGKSIAIGRSSKSDIVLNHPSVSRKHCVIEYTTTHAILRDNKSTNGVLVNGESVVGQRVLLDKDVIQILGYQLIFCGENLYYKKTARGIAIKGKNINKFVGRGSATKQILEDVNIDIDGNEFVAIIGGSGAGKSTLMNIINGTDSNFSGEIYYDNLLLENNFCHLKSLIGYVPQEDIIHDGITLRRMLYYAALMRMPDDTDEGEIDRTIDSVLISLDLKENEDTYVKKLSGGQKKRASIAVELLADPRVFFLDEPTSGLDPGIEKDLMITLRDMSRKQDRTIVIVTHTTQNLDLCDKIIFMGKGGRVCFVGSTEDAKLFFGTDDLTNAYNLVRENPVRWAKLFQDSKEKEAMFEDIARKKSNGNNSRHVPILRQYSIVTKRYVELILNDVKRLVALLVQPILIGILLAIVSDDDLFDIYESTKSMMFVLSCSAIWIGLFDSIQEICKERNIFRREYIAGLSPASYIMSKITVQLTLGVVQAILLTTTFLVLVGVGKEGILFDSFYFEIVLTVWITIAASVALGLAISAVVKTGDKAIAVAPFVLIIQLLFSGILFELKGASEYISYITISKWSVESVGSIAHLNELDLRLQGEFPKMIHEAEEMFEASVGHLLQDWGVLIFMVMLYSIISLFVIRNASKDER